jgi:hypothetical protein
LIKKRNASLFDKFFVHDTQSVFLRTKSSIDGIYFDNTMCAQLPSKISSPDMQGHVVGITVMNDVNSNVISVQNLPHNALGYNLARRNVTDYESEYEIIKVIDDEALGSAGLSHLELKENLPIFSDEREALKFVDDDVREENTYEYKLMYYRDNGAITKSVSSAIETYEERRNILNVDFIEGTPIDDNEETELSLSTTLTYTFRATLNESELDKVFASFDRNTFELFAEDFKRIKESIKKYLSCIAYLVNKSNSEKTQIGIFIPDQNNNNQFSISFDIPDIRDDYAVVIEPRYSTPTSIVSSIIDKIDTLPADNLKCLFLLN